MAISREERRVFLGMPGYGKQCHGAGRALWRACENMDHVWVAQEPGSLLAHNFNKLWCLAMNLVANGTPVHYFAMLHDDIEAKDGWLDALIDELEENNLDVLGVAVPIKDSRGLTSLAIHQEGDNWRPLARITMRELFTLPETFTSDDIGHKLLLNTGCWVCKFDLAWATKVHFEIKDAIGFDGKQYRALNESEDWFFSRLLHEIGSGATSQLDPLRIGATRKIPIAHVGERAHENTAPWGELSFDSDSAGESVIPKQAVTETPAVITSEV